MAELLLSTTAARAGIITWNTNPGSGDWNTATNWTPATIPNSSQDTATFGVSSVTGLSVAGTYTVKGITFSPGASPYTISLGLPLAQADFTFDGVGVINNSGITQNFALTGFGLDRQSLIYFLGAATAGTDTVFRINPLGSVTFFGTSSAANAVFVNHSGSLGIGAGGTALLIFRESSTAANSTITNEGDSNYTGPGGYLLFIEDSTAGNAFITNKGQGSLGSVLLFGGNATAGTATVVSERNSDGAGATVQFGGSASADHANFTIQGGAGTTYTFSRCLFTESATAGDATFTMEGAALVKTPGAFLTFDNTSSAGNANLIAKSGPGEDSTGGSIVFLSDSLGGSARVTVEGTPGRGTLAIDSHAAPGVTIGSLEGAGLAVLGANNLTVGSNNLSTTFSGTILNGKNGRNGSLTKIGSGALTLTGANSYNGGTTVSAGTLLASNSSGSATGSGAVVVNGGMLGGSGTISSSVTVSSGAILAPAGGTKVQATLTIQGALTLNNGATYNYSFKAKGSKAKTDKVTANGVTLNGASINLQGTTKGSLQTGTSYTVINNTAVAPIAGTFTNLADGAIVTVNGNNLQVNYHGGDGNDLTLTAVP